MERRFSYPIVHELDRKRPDPPPADREPLAPPRKSQRDLVVESLLRHPEGGSAPTGR